MQKLNKYIIIFQVIVDNIPKALQLDTIGYICEDLFFVIRLTVFIL